MTDDTGPALPDELRRALDVERVAEDLPREAEERLARRLMASIGSLEALAPPRWGMTQRLLRLKALAVFSSGALLGGAAGAALHAALRPTPAPVVIAAAAPSHE